VNSIDKHSHRYIPETVQAAQVSDKISGLFWIGVVSNVFNVGILFCPDIEWNDPDIPVSPPFIPMNGSDDFPDSVGGHIGDKDGIVIIIFIMSTVKTFSFMFNLYPLFFQIRD